MENPNSCLDFLETILLLCSHRWNSSLYPCFTDG